MAPEPTAIDPSTVSLFCKVTFPPVAEIEAPLFTDNAPAPAVRVSEPLPALTLPAVRLPDAASRNCPPAEDDPRDVEPVSETNTLPAPLVLAVSEAAFVVMAAAFKPMLPVPDVRARELPEIVVPLTCVILPDPFAFKETLLAPEAFAPSEMPPLFAVV